MRKLFILLAVTVASVSVASAQNYDKAIGLRLGYGGAIDFKWNVSEVNSWNFNLSVPAFSGFSASAAYQWNWPLGDLGVGGQGFNAYAGPAAGLGYLGVAGYKGTMISVGGHGGIEYKFNAPIALAIDLKPMFTYITGSDFSGLWGTGLADFGLVVRYTF
jgi:hypothetical protein